MSTLALHWCHQQLPTNINVSIGHCPIISHIQQPYDHRTEQMLKLLLFAICCFAAFTTIDALVKVSAFVKFKKLTQDELFTNPPTNYHPSRLKSTISAWFAKSDKDTTDCKFSVFKPVVGGGVFPAWVNYDKLIIEWYAADDDKASLKDSKKEIMDAMDDCLEFYQSTYTDLKLSNIETFDIDVDGVADICKSRTASNEDWKDCAVAGYGQTCYKTKSCGDKDKEETDPLMVCSNSKCFANFEVDDDDEDSSATFSPVAFGALLLACATTFLF